MKRVWIGVALLLLSCGAGAQMYKWVDKDGKVRYGDTPPPGAKTSTVRAPSSGEASAAPDSKDAKKGPLTPAEQEQEYRKRQQQAQKDAAKQADEAKRKAELSDDCARTREYIATLESGARIQRTNPSGERYYLDESQVQQEVAKARQSMQACK